MSFISDDRDKRGTLIFLSLLFACRHRGRRCQLQPLSADAFRGQLGHCPWMGEQGGASWGLFPLLGEAGIRTPRAAVLCLQQTCARACAALFAARDCRPSRNVTLCVNCQFAGGFADASAGPMADNAVCESKQLARPSRKATHPPSCHVISAFCVAVSPGAKSRRPLSITHGRRGMDGHGLASVSFIGKSGSVGIRHACGPYRHTHTTFHVGCAAGPAFLLHPVPQEHVPRWPMDAMAPCTRGCLGPRDACPTECLDVDSRPRWRK